MSVRVWLQDRNNKFAFFKYTVYFLLTLNIYLFSVSGTLTETIDTAAWVVILALFEWETRTMGRERSSLEKALLWILGLGSYGVIVYACYSYMEQSMWLDFDNSLTWILVILGMEYEVWDSGPYSLDEWQIRNIVKFCLYGALFVFAVLWGFEGEFLDFYDAVLWLLSFIVIELNIFEFEHKRLL